MIGFTCCVFFLFLIGTLWKSRCIVLIFNTSLNKTNSVMLNSSEEIARLKSEIIELKEKLAKYDSRISVENKFSELYDSIPIGIMYYNYKGIVVDCNDFFVTIIGSSKQDLIGFDMMSTLKDMEMKKAINSSLIKGEGRYEGVYKSITAEKETPVRVIFKGLKNDDNIIYGGICIAEDLTEFAKTCKELKKTEENYRHIFENTTDVYYHMDTDGKIMLLNPAVKDLLLLEKSDDYTGRNLSVFFKDSSELVSLIDKLKKTGQIDGYKTEMVRSDNSVITVEINLKAVYDLTNNISSIVGVFYDVSERIKSEKERSNHIWFLKRLKKIDEIIKESTDDNDIITNALKSLKDALKCDCIMVFEKNDSAIWNLYLNQHSHTKQNQKICSDDLVNDKPISRILEKLSKLKGVQFISGNKNKGYDVILDKIGSENLLSSSLKLNSGSNLVVLIRGINKNRIWNDHETTLVSEVMSRLKDAVNTYYSTELLNKSEEHHRRLIEATSEGYWEVDNKGITILANNAMCEMLGYTMDEFIGSLSFIHILPTSKQQVHELIAQQTISGTSSFEVELRHKNGNIIHTVVNSTQRINKLNETKGTFFFVTDISNQKKVEQRLKESEIQLRLLFNSMSDAVIEIDYNGKYISIAPTRPNRILPSKKSVGKSFHDFFPKQQADQLLSFVRSCLDDNKPKSIEYPVEKDNETYWLEGRAVPKTDNTILLVSHDITSRRSAIHKLRQSERDHKSLSNLLRKIIDTSPEMIWAKDNFGKYTITNEAITRKLLNAKDVEEPIGKHIMHFVEREQLAHQDNNSWYTFGQDCEETDKMVLQSKRPGRFDEHGIVFGKYLFLDVYKAPIFDEKGIITGTVGFARDVTYEKKVEREKEDFRKELELKNIELKEVNQNLKLALEKARESDELKTSFIKNISHEVRTPLNGIVGFLEILNSDSLTKDERTEYTNYVMNSSDQLTSIITDILEYSRLEAGQIKVNNSRFCINQLLKDIYSVYFSKLISKNKSHIKLDLDKKLIDSKNIISGDKEKILQIFTNLLNNAVKFTSKGKIVFGYSSTETTIDFFVHDTGIGIHDCDKEIIFHKFRRGTGADTPAYGGNGLGLAITKSLTELMNGNIWFESEVGVGTKFHVSIPVKPGKPILDLKNIGSLDLPDKWSSKKVLIVDDVYEVFRLISIYLLDTKIVQFYAKNGTEAVQICKQHNDIDIVLLDLHLPDIDGYKTLELLREINPELVVIAQTAFAISNDRNKTIKAGFNDYVTKPITRTDLIDIMGKYL